MDVAWTTESGGRRGGRQNDGHLDRTTVEDEALLDHHIEEVLGTVGDAVRLRESDAELEGQRPD